MVEECEDESNRWNNDKERGSVCIESGLGKEPWRWLRRINVPKIVLEFLSSRDIIRRRWIIEEDQ